MKIKLCATHGKTQLNMATVLQGKLEEKRIRVRGRPSVSYISNLESNANMGMHKIVQRVSNRDEWRKVVYDRATAIEPSDADQGIKVYNNMQSISLFQSTILRVIRGIPSMH